MKTAAVILATIIGCATFALGQTGPDNDPQYTVVNHYDGKTRVDDGFGGAWNVHTMVDEPKSHNYILYRTPDRYFTNSGSLRRQKPREFQMYEDSTINPYAPKPKQPVGRFAVYPGKNPTVDWGPGLNKKLRPIWQAAHRVFCKHLIDPWMGNEEFILNLWVDPVSGRIIEVGYGLGYNSDNYNGECVIGIPPKRYTRFERVLKRTMRFDISDMKPTEDESEYGYLYRFIVRLPTPAECKNKILKKF